MLLEAMLKMAEAVERFLLPAGRCAMSLRITFMIRGIMMVAKWSPISTRIYFLVPLSSRFRSRTACAVVPEPAKKSSKMPPRLSTNHFPMIFNNAIFFSVENPVTAPLVGVPIHTSLFSLTFVGGT